MGDPPQSRACFAAHRALYHIAEGAVRCWTQLGPHSDGDVPTTVEALCKGKHLDDKSGAFVGRADVLCFASIALMRYRRLWVSRLALRQHATACSASDEFAHL